MPPRRITVDKPLLHLCCSLGEGNATHALLALAFISLHTPIGPLYDPETSVLHFVDIEENKVSIRLT